MQIYGSKLVVEEIKRFNFLVLMRSNSVLDRRVYDELHISLPSSLCMQSWSYYKVLVFKKYVKWIELWRSTVTVRHKRSCLII